MTYKKYKNSPEGKYKIFKKMNHLRCGIKLKKRSNVISKLKKKFKINEIFFRNCQLFDFKDGKL